jgi:hypothetical protein
MPGFGAIEAVSVTLSCQVTYAGRLKGARQPAANRSVDFCRFGTVENVQFAPLPE